MNHRSNPTSAAAAPTDLTIRTRRAVEVCVVCGHEHIHGHRRQVSCPECATGACSFLLVRGPREVDR